MAWEELHFKISADMDFGNATSQVNNIKKGIEELKGSIADMPNVSKILDNSLEKSASIATSLAGKISKLESGKFRTNEERVQLEKSIGQDISELNTLRKLQTGTGDFSVSLARSWFGDLPSAVQRELDVIVPKLSSIIRARMGSIKGQASTSFKGKTQADIAASAMRDPEIKALAEKYITSAEAKNQLKGLIKDIIPHVAPANRLNAYQLKRYGSVLTSEAAALSKGNILDLFPESFKQAYQNKGYTKRSFAAEQGRDVLSKEAVKELNQMLQSRPIMAKAALAAGISRRDARGVLETKNEISRQEWENYRGALYDELITRVSGYGKGKTDPYSSIKKDVDKLVSRLTSSTSGDTMTGLHDIEKFENAGSWTTGTGSKRYTKLNKEARRALDEYVVTKYSPFMKHPDGTKVKPKEVMITESHNTRLLGEGKWKNNDDVSDTIAVVSLAGYDPNDKKQQKQLYNLYKNGKVINGKKFIAQSTHGKGDDQVIRMIEKSAYDRVNQQEAEFASSLGLRGTYWGGFEEEEIKRRIKNPKNAEDKITAETWGKHLEMQNKSWTPSADMGISMKGKKIAVVDFQGKGDGATWASSSMMPDSAQIRMGIGGKGSVFVFNGKNVGDFAAKTGIADNEGRVMMRGPDGKMYDVSGYDMVMPLDAIKNLGAYKDENGNFVSGERASQIATGLASRYGIGMVANYTKEDNRSNHLGTQMSSFINFTPEIQERQIEMTMNRIRELDTEAGQLKYVFGDQSDWLSRKVHEDPQLLNSEAAKRRIDAYKLSIMQKTAGGEYTDFGENSGISDMRLVASPLAAYLASHGGIKDGKVLPSVIAKAREYLGADSEKYTDEQISNMIIPPKDTVLDFAHKEHSKVAVIRSPTGYGNMVAAENIAAAAEPIYKGFGIATNAGIYVSDQDLERLQGADFDADEAKVIYDEELRKSVEESAKQQPFVKVKIGGKIVEYTPEQLADPAMQQTLRAGRAVVMNAGMSSGSSGIRIMQLDLSKPSNQEYIKEAQRLSAYYDNRTVFDKKANDMAFEDVQAWNTMRLGREYTKFSDKISDLFAFDEDLLGADDKPDENADDVFRASNGELVNLKRLRNMGVDNINLPAVNMANHRLAVIQQGELYKAGLVQTNYMDAVAEAMDHIGYGDAEGENGVARRKLMSTMRHLLPQFGTGERTMLTAPEVRAISSMITAAETELRADAGQYLDPATGKYIADGKTYDDLKSFAKAREKLYGINTAKNAIESFGITEGRLQWKFGDNYGKYFSNASPSNIELLPEDKEEIEYAKKDKILDEEIIKAKEQVAEEEKEEAATAKKTRRKKKTVEQKLVDSEIENLRKTLKLGKKVDIDKEIEKETDLLRSADESSQQKLSEDRLQGLNQYKSLLQKKEELEKTPAKKRLESLLQDKEKLSADRQLNYKASDMRTEYQALLSDVREYSDMIWGYQKGKENKINDDKSFAEKYWSRSFYDAKNRIEPLKEFEKKISESGFEGEGSNDMLRGISAEFLQGISQAEQELNVNIQKDFANKSILYAKTLSEDMAKELDKQQNAPSAQKNKIDSYNEKIKNAKSFTAELNRQLTSGKVEPSVQKMYEDAVISTNKYIEAAEDAKENLITEYTKQNELHGKLSVENLQIKHGLRNKNSIGVRSELRQREIQDARSVIDKQYQEGFYSKDQYEAITGDLNNLQKHATPAMMGLEQGLKTVKSQIISTSSHLINMFSRRMFQTAIAETKRFVKEFNQSMTTIQMITLKSNEEMSKLGDTLIDKAKELKVSISEISKSAETLYRQGLTDEEVDERLEVISKFSKVSGTKVEDATKLITVAMNTGLVSNPQFAADIVTALGDNAATNAAQIEKGIEKAGAAAAADGTTFAELAAMLTAITSTTQIGGNVAGRTLNTIFGRINKIGTNELIYDENGNAVSGSAVAKLLRAQGIEMYDQSGKKRSSYDVLYDLSRRWDSMQDSEQQMMATAIAGTRQYSNFAAIMQGMSEGKVDEYMRLVAGSEGITDQKYEIYTKNLQAALIDLQNTFDNLVNDLIDKGYVQEFISGITTMIDGVDNLVNSLGGLQASLPVVMTLVGALTGLKIGSISGAGGIGALFGAIAGLGTYAGLTSLGASASNIDYRQNILDYQKEQTASAQANLARAQGMYESYKNGTMSQEDILEFNKIILDINNTLSNAFSQTELSALGLSGSFDSVKDELDAYATAIDAKVKRENEQQFRKTFDVDLSDVIESKYKKDDGKVYTDAQKEFIEYIRDNFSKNGILSWSNNGFAEYARDITARGLTSGGFIDIGEEYFIDIFRDQINELIQKGKLIQGYKREGNEYVPVPYTSIEDLYHDFASRGFVEPNGVSNQNDTNLETIFEYLLGGNRIEENVENQTEYARSVVSSSYGDRLKTALSGLGYIDEDLSNLIIETYINNVLEGIKGEIIQSNQTGAEEKANIPAKIVDESTRLVDDIYGLIQAENPLKAFQDYVIAAKKTNASFMQDHKQELGGLKDDEVDEVIRNILFPVAQAENEALLAETVDYALGGRANSLVAWETDKANSYKLIADRVYNEMLSSGATDIDAWLKYVNDNQIRDFANLYQDSEFGLLMSQVQQNAETGNYEAPTDMMDQIVRFLLSKGTRGEAFVSTRQKAGYAQSMFNSLISGENAHYSEIERTRAQELEAQARAAYEKSIQEQMDEARKLHPTFGEEEFEKYEAYLRANASYAGPIAYDRVYTEDEQKYLQELVGNELFDKLTGKGGLQATQEEKDYAEMLISNRALGISSLLSSQQLAGFKDVRANISKLGLEGGYSRTVADAYMSQWSDWEEYAALIEAQNAKNQELFKKLGGTSRLNMLTASLNTYEKTLETNAELEDARKLSGSTFGATNAYAQLLYNENNKAGLAANSLIEVLSSENIRTFGDLNDILGDRDNLDNWTKLIEAVPNLTKEIQDMGYSIDENGHIDWSSLDESKQGLDTVLGDLIRIIASHSEAYQNILYKTRSDIYQEASDYALNGTEANATSYAQIVGSDIAARRAKELAGVPLGEGTEPFFMKDEEREYANMLMQNYGRGIVGLTDYQKATGAQALFDSIKNGAYNDIYGDQSQDMINAYMDAIPGLREYFNAVQSGEEDTKKLAERQKDVEAAIQATLITARGYGDATSKAAQFAQSIKKGGTEASKAKIALDAEMKSIQDQQTALSKASGKSGKELKNAGQAGDRTLEILSGMFEYDADQIAQMSADEIQKLIDEAGPMVQEQFYNIVQGLFESLPETTANVNLADMVRVNADGSIDLTDVADVLTSYEEEIVQMILSLAGKYADIDVSAILNGDEVTVESFVKALRSAGVKTGSGYSRGSSGGGGGGKSATDTLIEKQKHKVSEIQHDANMLSIREQYLDFANDYAGLNSNVDEQIAVQNRLRDAYAQNISELQAQLATVASGSDDWYKLKDAIMSAQEALASVNNTINQLNSKKLEILVEKQTNQDKPHTHAGSMLDKMAQRYQTIGDFANYEAITQQQQKLYQTQIDQNKRQVSELEGLLKQYVEGSDAWIKTRDEIWKLKEQNAEIENQILSSEIELDRARLTQLTTDYQNSIAPIEHDINMLSTYGGMYQNVNDREGYRQTLRDQNTSNETKLSAVRQTISSIKEQMNAIKEGTTAWFDAREALYQYEEMEAQLNASLLETNILIGESKVQELNEKFSESTKHLNHELNMLNAYGEGLKKDGDLANYQNLLGDKIEVTTQALAAQNTVLDEMKEALNDPEITDGAYRTLVDQIEASEEAVIATTNSLKDLYREMHKIQLESLNLAFNYGDGKNYTIGDTELQHDIQMYQYQGTKYQNKKELTNYGKILREETNLQKTRSANIARFIEDLKAQRNAIEDDDEAVKEYDSTIYKWEEELEKVNNTILKNEEALKQNAVQVLKTRQAVESQIDQEIRNRIQEEKNRLNATISIENTIIETIRKNKREEWNLEKQTIQKKKEALNEEKNLLNERLQARKSAIQTEEKYEELARLKSQLALIQADASRTKEAKELAKRISDIEKELAWQIADEQASATSKMLDDQISGWDQYMSDEEKYLSEYLENTVNFRQELDNILNGTVEDFLDFMHKNSKEYINSTAEMQAQMDQGWRDTFKTMTGELTTYWNEVDETMRNREGFINYMKQSTQYESASETGKSILEAGWGDMYDAFIAAYKDDAEYKHDHEADILNKVDELKEWTFKVDFDTQKDTLLNIQYTLSDLYEIMRQEVMNYNPYDNYTGVGAKPKPAAPAATTSTPTTTTTTSSASTWTGDKFFEVYDEKGIKTYYYIAATDLADAKVKAKRVLGSYYNAVGPGLTTRPKNGKVYKEGGLVDYTGLAWVDGTKSDPEAFINSTDRKNIRAMLDAFTYVNTPYMSHIDTSRYGNNVSVGDVTVTINEAQINNDQDIAELARKIGSAFTKELTKSGLNSAAYAW